jgi:phosphoribosylformylglycinamidine synthase
MHINLHDICKDGDIVKTLFAENPGVVIEVSDEHKEEFKEFMEDAGVGYAKIGYSVPESRNIEVIFAGGNGKTVSHTFDIDALRDTWYKTSYLLDRKQSFNGKAKERFENYKKQPLEMKFNKQGALFDIDD